MGILNRFFAPIESKASAVAHTLFVHGNPVAWMKRDYKAFAKEAYMENVIAFQAINQIADAAASVKWLAYDANNEEKELPKHPLLQLIKNPNPMQSGDQYMRAKVAYLVLSGNGYEEKVEVRGNPAELYQLRPDRVKIIKGENGFPQRYVHTVNEKSVKFEVDQKTGKSGLRHLKTFNPLDDWYGMSPIEAGAKSIDQSNQSMTWLQGLLQNSARPSGALVTQGEAVLDPEAINRLKTQIEQQYSGGANAGRPLLLHGGMKWQAMGMSPTDMGIQASRYDSAREICLSLGVPPLLLGIPGDNTYANYKEARLAFWEDTVIPLLEMIAADWTASLGDGKVELRPNIDIIPAIVEKRQALWDMIDKSKELTLDEKRIAKGYDPLPNGAGEVLLVGSGQVPITDLMEPSEGTPEEDDALAFGDPAEDEVEPDDES